jgi:hypothetical protein
VPLEKSNTASYLLYPMLLTYFIYSAEQVSDVYRVRVRVGYVIGTYRVRHVAYQIILIGLIGQYGLWYD